MSSNSSPATIAAVSSIASGRPSTRRQISPISPTARSVSSDGCVLSPARSRNRRTAGHASISARPASEPATVNGASRWFSSSIDPQRLATRRKHMQAREPSDELLDELGHRRDDVLTVVEHEQEITVRQPPGERIHIGLAARALQPDLRGHLARDEVR